MSLGKIIKKLRRERDMTQDQLAEILSISPQAVSRWETDVAMPDISLIAPLCNLFGITSDELLGIDIARRKEMVSAICDEADKYSQKGYLSEARKILEEGLSKYPDNLEIVYNLMYLSSLQKDSTGDKKYLNEAIQYGEKILAQSTEEPQRQGAIQILCYSYRDAGRLDEAIKMAESMPYLSLSREVLLSAIHSGDKAYYHKQCEATNLLQLLSNSLYYLQTRLDSGENAYTNEECAILRNKRIALLNLFYEDADFGFYHTHLCDTHRDQALYYAKKGDDDNALMHLRAAAEHAVKFIESNDEERTSLVFRGMKRGSFTTSDSNNNAARLLELMDNSIFDGIRSADEFVKITNDLTGYAGKWTVQ